MMKIFRTYLLTVFACILLFISCITESTPDYTLTTTVNPAESGTITPNTGSFYEGEVVSLQATPAERWVFSRWEQDLNTTANPMNITMTQDYNIVGVFERAWPVDTETAIVDVTNPATGRTWMDRNLGASRAATSPTDTQALGDLYQWGRPADGHQKKNSPTTTNQSSSDQPGHGSFIEASDFPRDWRTPQNDNLWQGVNGINNPCPDGYRLPTAAEWEAERQSWSRNHPEGAFASPLKLIMGGYRYFFLSIDFPPGDGGRYWSSSIDDAYARLLYFTDLKGTLQQDDSRNAFIGEMPRTRGLSVRCTKE